MAIFDVNSCEEKIGYVFKDKMLLRQCFTHASYAFEHGESDNELLEFFGDAIIEFVVTEYLVKNSPGDEGVLTAKRADMVSKKPLLDAVNEMRLESFILLGNGQKKTANESEKLFSSVFEAITAGIYTDGGLSEAKKFIYRTIIAKHEEKLKKEKAAKPKTDYKSMYQEYVQKNKLGGVSYETLARTGPDHMPEFRVAALLNGVRLAEGKGPNKKEAETKAACAALSKLKKQAGK